MIDESEGHTGESLVYMVIDGKGIILDKGSCIELFDAMSELDGYLNLR